MRGLNGDRLLKQFVGSLLRRPNLDPLPVVNPTLDIGEETPKSLGDSTPEKVQGKCESEDIEDTNILTPSFDP